MSELSEVLQLIRVLLKCGWHKKTLFRDENGEQCGIAQAASFCVIGAVLAATDGKSVELRREVQVLLKRMLPEPQSLSVYNDRADVTHDDILNLVDKAIAYEQLGV